MMSDMKPVGVFWDIENCHVPKGKSALKIIERIRERFFTNYREAEFICVCDINKESDCTIKDLNDGQINVVHINATAKNAADNKIRQSLRRFSDSHPPGTKVILISSDVNFAPDLSDLRHRKRFEVVLIHKSQVSDTLLLCATEHYLYEDLIRDLPDRPGLKEEASDCVLVVSGYAKEGPVDRVRAILKMHSNNCGGKVISIGPLFALLKFETPELMERAKKRMNGEDVYGRKITVCLPEETTFQNTIRKLTASQMARRQESPSPQRFGRPKERSRSYTPEQDTGYNHQGYQYFQPYEQYHNYLRGPIQESKGYQFVPSSVSLNKAYKTPGGPVQQQPLPRTASPSTGMTTGSNPALSPNHTYTLPNSNSERYYVKSSPVNPESESRPNSAPTAASKKTDGQGYVIGDLSGADSSNGQTITVFKPADSGKSLKDIPIPSFGFSTIPPPRLPSKTSVTPSASCLDPSVQSFDPIKLIETASKEMQAFGTSTLYGSNGSQASNISHPEAQTPPKYQTGKENSGISGSNWTDRHSVSGHRTDSPKKSSSDQVYRNKSPKSSSRNSSPKQSAFTKLTTSGLLPYAACDSTHQQHQSRSTSVPGHVGAMDSRTFEDEICRMHGYPPPTSSRSHSQGDGAFRKPAAPQKPFKSVSSSNFNRRTSPANRPNVNRDQRASFSSDGEDRANSPSSWSGRQGHRGRLSSQGKAGHPVSRRTPSPLTTTGQKPKLTQHGSNLYRVPTPNEMGDPSTDYINENFDMSRGDPYVELVVSNLDYNIHPREWRKIIYATFHPHVQVLSIQVRLQADNTSVATVRLPTEQDARFAITQFHRRKIGYKRINVQLKSDCSQSPAESLRADTIALLMEAKDNKLALSRLIDLFDKRFHKTVSVSDIYKMRDTIQIQETGGAGRWVRLQPGIRRSPIPSTQTEGESLEIPEQPVCLIHCPEGGVQYTEVMNACMLPNVQIMRKHFAPQLHSLLLSHNGYIPLMSFPLCYAAEFSPLPTVEDEGIPLEHVISCVPGVEIIMSKQGVKIIQFQENREQFYDMMKGTSWQELGKISREVMELLRGTPNCSMPVSKFIPAYHQHFGRQCRVADYGYTKLQELFEAIPHAIQILGTGDRKTITLSPRAQLKRFTTDIIKVVKAQPAKQIMLQDFPKAYEKVMMKPLHLPHYGVAFVEDVLMDIPTTTLIVIKESSHTLLALPRRDQTPEEVERTKQFALEVVDLLKHNPQSRMAFNKFIPAYHHHFGKQCRVADYGFSKLTDLFESVAHVIELEEDGEERFLHLTAAEQRKVLCEQLVGLIRPVGRIPAGQLLLQYANHYGFCLKLEEFGVSSVNKLVQKLRNNIQLEVVNGQEFVTLVQEVRISSFGLKVIQLLMDESGGSLPLMELCSRFESMFGETCNVEALKEDLQDFVQIDDSDGDRDGNIRLTSQQMLGRNLRLLLLHTDSILMSDLCSLYRQQYGVELSPALYGFQSLYQLLMSFPHILEVRGKPHHKYITLSKTFSKPGTIPPTRVDVSPNQFATTSPDAQQANSNNSANGNGDQQNESPPLKTSPAYDLLRHASHMWNSSLASQPSSNAAGSSSSNSPIASTRIMDMLRDQTANQSPSNSHISSNNGRSLPVAGMKQLKISPNGVPEDWQMVAGGDKKSSLVNVIRGNLGMQNLDERNKMEVKSDSSGVSHGEKQSRECSSTSFKEGESEEDIFAMSDPPLDTSSANSNQSISPVKTTPSSTRKSKKRIVANFNKPQ